MAQVQLNNVVLIYNKYLVQLLTDLKDVDIAARDSIRAVLKAAGVRAIDHESPLYISLNLGEDDPTLLPGVRVSSLTSAVAGGPQIARPFAALLNVLAATYHAADDTLATQALRAISSLQAGSPEAADHLAAIFDDDVQARLRVLVSVMKETAGAKAGAKAGASVYADPATSASATTESDGGTAFMEALAGSSIATIAKEIADELVDSDLLKDFGTDPTKIDFASLLDPNSKLGGVAKIVSSKLHEQLGSGKLDQGKLMTEVMSMFGNLNGGGPDQSINPLLSQVMNMARQMGTGSGTAAGAGAGFSGAGAASAGALRRAAAGRLHNKVMKRAG